MAITSYGYDGSIGESVWARMAPRVGTPYWVTDPTHLAMTKNTSVDRGVDISPGEFGGAGVFDTSNEKVTLRFDPVSSGWRYDLIVARRNWQGVGGKTEFKVVKGGSVRRIPAFHRNPGVLDDQLLALIPIQAGRAQVDGIIDLRGFAMNSAAIVRDPLALEGYNNWPGMVVHVGREIYTLQPDRTWVRTGLIHAVKPAYRFRMRRKITVKEGAWTLLKGGWTLTEDNSMGVKVLPSGHVEFPKSGQYTITTNVWADTRWNNIGGSTAFRMKGLWVQPDYEVHKNSYPKGQNQHLTWNGTINSGDRITLEIAHWNRSDRRMTYDIEINIEMVG